MSKQETALAETTNAGLAEVNLDGFTFTGEIDINTLSSTDRFELLKRIINAKADLDAIGLPMVQSRQAIDFPFGIVDAAYVYDMLIDPKKPEKGTKTCVRFVLQADADHPTLDVREAEFFTVLKSSNKFNDRYVDLYTELRGVATCRMDGYTFVEDARYENMGNKAVVLRKIRPEKAVNAKAKSS